MIEPAFESAVYHYSLGERKIRMPTQEERLETVEYGLKQFKTETIKAYEETAIELLMVKGLTEDAVKRLASSLDLCRAISQIATAQKMKDAHIRGTLSS